MEKARSKLKTISNSGKKHVALVTGGISSEREISLNSAALVAPALAELGYQVTLVDMGCDIGKVLWDIKPDVVFNLLLGEGGEDGQLPGLLNIMKIPYTSSGVLASAAAMNKEVAKQIFALSGIDVLPGVVLKDENDAGKVDFSGPYVIKPNNGGSSIGACLIHDQEFNPDMELDFSHGELLVEKFAVGMELTTALLDGKVLGTAELRAKAGQFRDYKIKYSAGSTIYNMPPLLPGHVLDSVAEAARAAYDAIGCRGFARADFIFSEHDQKPYILEINAIPAMTKTSVFSKIAEHYCSMSFKDLVDEILKLARYD